MSAKRIVIVGTTGSGKSTLAHRLAEHWQVPHVELDSLHWERDWVEAPLEVFRQRVDDKLSSLESFVCDGNYGKVRDIVWSKADSLIWLDYPLLLILWRLFWRTMQRSLTRQELWQGNRERLYAQFFTRDSLFLWALTSHFRHRREYPTLFQEPQYKHIQVIRQSNPGQTERWFKALQTCPRQG